MIGPRTSRATRFTASQSPLEAIGKPGQDLASQVVRDVAVVAGELADELGPVRAVVQ